MWGKCNWINSVPAAVGVAFLSSGPPPWSRVLLEALIMKFYAFYRT
jgi:hypothetical protein